MTGGRSGVRSAHDLRRGSGRSAAERGRPVAVPPDRRLRLPLELPHRRAGRPGRRDRLAVRPALRLTEHLRHDPGPPGRLLPVRPVRRLHAGARAVRAGDQRAGHHLAGPRRLDGRARRAHARAAPDGGHASRRTRGRRSTTTPTICSSARSSASTAPSTSTSSASPCSTTGASPADWTLPGDDRHAADATGAGLTIRLTTDLLLGIEGDRVRAPPAARAGRARVLHALVGRGARVARRHRRGDRAAGPRRRGSGARGSAARGSPITAGASRSSARRSRSRA